MEDFPRKDYQLYGLAALRKAVNGLYDAAATVDRMLVKVADYGIDEVVEDPAKFYESLQQLRIGSFKPAGMSSGITDGLFLIRMFAHELALCIPQPVSTGRT